MINACSLSIESETIPNQINSSLESLSTKKLHKLLKIIENNRLIYSLKCYRQLINNDLVTFWIRIVQENIQPDNINNEFYLIHCDLLCLYPYSLQEFRTICPEGYVPKE